MPKKIVRRSSLSDQATDILRESILSLEIEPGERLIVDNLAEKFNISRTPIREALRNLTVQGLISYNGIVYRVTRLTREDIIELYSVREALEVLAAAQAAEKATATQLRKLEQINGNYDLKLSQRKLIDLDMEFHQMIQEASRNTRLQAMLKTISEQILLVRRWLFQDQSRKSIEGDTINEHSAIVQSIADHEPEKAAELMKYHLTRGKQRLLTLLDVDKRFLSAVRD
ncbi:MAG: GntR family transcriptional regulator [Sphaerochaetaceae bacterium]|nr:GntR family transcriptional regulator [Spirochaetales bacterium]